MSPENKENYNNLLFLNSDFGCYYLLFFLKKNLSNAKLFSPHSIRETREEALSVTEAVF